MVSKELEFLRMEWQAMIYLRVSQATSYRDTSSALLTRIQWNTHRS